MRQDLLNWYSRINLYCGFRTSAPNVSIGVLYLGHGMTLSLFIKVKPKFVLTQLVKTT